MSPRISRKVGLTRMKKNTAGESEGIAGQTRHIPGSAGRLHPSPPLLRQHSSPAPIGNQREA